MTTEEQLTKEENKILKALTKYGSLTSAAKNMSIPQNKIYKISKNIKTKLQARNLTNAVYIASQKNYI